MIILVYLIIFGILGFFIFRFLWSFRWTSKKKQIQNQRYYQLFEIKDEILAIKEEVEILKKVLKEHNFKDIKQKEDLILEIAKKEAKIKILENKFNNI